MGEKICNRKNVLVANLHYQRIVTEKIGRIESLFNPVKMSQKFQVFV